MHIRLIFTTMMLDETLGCPVVVLSEEGSTRSLRAPLTPFEANAIAMAHAGQDTSLSYPTDLTQTILVSFGAKIDRAMLRRSGEVLRARLELSTEGAHHLIDCRIADALILCLRNHCDLVADETAFGETEGSDADKLRARIASTDTLSFGSLLLS